MIKELFELWLSASSLYPPKMKSWFGVRELQPLQLSKAKSPLTPSITGSIYIHWLEIML
jgi:hypothetical protein